MCFFGCMVYSLIPNNFPFFHPRSLTRFYYTKNFSAPKSDVIFFIYCDEEIALLLWIWLLYTFQNINLNLCYDPGFDLFFKLTKIILCLTSIYSHGTYILRLSPADLCYCPYHTLNISFVFCLRLFNHVCVFEWVCVCVNVSMWVCVYVRVCMGVYMCVYKCV